MSVASEAPVIDIDLRTTCPCTIVWRCNQINIITKEQAILNSYCMVRRCIGNKPKKYIIAEKR